MRHDFVSPAHGMALPLPCDLSGTVVPEHDSALPVHEVHAERQQLYKMLKKPRRRPASTPFPARYFGWDGRRL